MKTQTINFFLPGLLFSMILFNSCTKPVGDNHQTEYENKPAYISYLDSLEGKGALSGHFIRWNYNASLEEIRAIHDSSGQWVSMLGADYYGNFQDSVPAPPCDYALTNEVLKKYLTPQGIVNLSVHVNNPQTLGSAWDNTIDFDSLFVEDSRVQQIFLNELECISEGLRDLSNANVNIMFRPFHEMNGGWFWWGDHKEQFVELWHMTYEFMVQEKGLTGLLWCYSPDAGQPGYMDYYPGDEYVDIVGLDAYTPDLPEKAKEGYKTLIKLNKPFGFTEYGCVSGNPDQKEIFDFSVMAEWLKEDFPKAVFFLSWRDHWGMARNTGINKLLNHPHIINRQTDFKE